MSRSDFQIVINYKPFEKVIKMETSFNTIKIFKITKVAPTCFGLHKPSSGSYSLCLAKITFLVPVYMSLTDVFSVMAAYMKTPTGAICLNTFARFCVDGNVASVTVAGY